MSENLGTLRYISYCSNGMTPGAASIGSASSLAYRLRSRESAVSLTSVDSVKSTTSIVPSKYIIISCLMFKSLIKITDFTLKG